MDRKPPPRLPAFDYRGFHRYLLTICTYDRDPVFSRTDFATTATEHLRQCAEQSHFAVIAYCFMPDHLHVLCAGENDEADFREFVRVFKQKSAYYAKLELGITLWQRSFYEHVLRNDESTELAARYLLANPVRAGLVESPEEYPYLGSFVTTVQDLMMRAQEISLTYPNWADVNVGPYR
jgi:putative transposase